MTCGNRLLKLILIWGWFLLRLADFAARRVGRLQKSERCAKHSSLFRPLDAVAVLASCA